MTTSAELVSRAEQLKLPLPPRSSRWEAAQRQPYVDTDKLVDRGAWIGRAWRAAIGMPA